MQFCCSRIGGVTHIINANCINPDLPTQHDKKKKDTFKNEKGKCLKVVDNNMLKQARWQPCK